MKGNHIIIPTYSQETTQQHKVTKPFRQGFGNFDAGLRELTVSRLLIQNRKHMNSIQIF